jgi:4-diphosphocytidyl-2-C-methyl-D-erythritol kinase
MSVHKWFQSVSTLSVFSPAKINLFLAITGRRADGFHELVSVVAPVSFGDTLTLHVVRGERSGENGEGKPETGKQFTLECDDSAVPVDESNLVLRAAAAFAEATLRLGSGQAGWPFDVAQGRRGGVHFRLEKRIPMGAGLGGGSSNAVAALRALNQLAGGPLDATRLAEIAATLGSDCPLFLHDGPVLISGRGEKVSRVWPEADIQLRERRVLIFKPPFGISTAWAYGRMAAEAPRSYLNKSQARERVGSWMLKSELSLFSALALKFGSKAKRQERLAAWMARRAPAEDLLFNNMEGVAFGKYLALPVLLDALRERLGLAVRMSGSGSACFALLPDGAAGDRLVARAAALVREHWGEAAFVTEAKIL